jgi:uncharacterized membrane protein YtjA (UPF0391 family)
VHDAKPSTCIVQFAARRTQSAEIFPYQSITCDSLFDGMPIDISFSGGAVPHNAPPLITQRRYVMLHYALVFLVVALIAAALGFGGIAGAAAGVAKILFVIFLVLFIASLVAGGLRRF